MNSVVLASTQENLGIAFVVALILGWAVFLFLSVKKSGEAQGDEAATAPNRRPYLDDEAMEGRRLEGAQKAAGNRFRQTVWNLQFRQSLSLHWVSSPP